MDDWKTRVTQIRSIQPSATPGQACLVLIYAGAPGAGEIGRRFELSGEEMIIGRGSDADIQIDRDSVSRRHARLYRQDGGWAVCDLQSTNGSYVNDMPIVEHTLRDGELLKIGNAIFKFLSGPSVEAAYYEEIYRMTIMDGLTLAYNKRYFLENLERELARCSRYGRALALVLFDIDHFKQINDRYSHAVGDQALIAVAEALCEGIDGAGTLARWGGEEFGVLFERIPLERAHALCEAMRQRVEAINCSTYAPGLRLSISGGVAELGDAQRVEALVARADALLYEAKRGGRNRICA